MFRLDDIHSLTDFQRRTREHLERLKKTRRPAVLTLHGQAEVVIQSADAYQELLDRLERAEAVAGLREGLESMERGEGRPLRDSLEEVRATGGGEPPGET